MEKEIIKIIKKYKFKDFDQLKYYLKDDENFKDIDPAYIRKVFNKYNKRRALRTYNKFFMGNKFSAFDNAWQMDIFKVKSASSWLLCININTKYAWTSEIKENPRGGISNAAFLPKLKEFVQMFDPKIIECDEERAFTSIKTTEYLSSQNIILKITPKKYHGYLSVINRLCKTLSEKIFYEDNLNESDPEQEQEEELKEIERDWDDSEDYNDSHDVAIDDVKSLVDVYNKTYNRAIKMTPEEMMKDKRAQAEYIFNQMEIRDKKDKMNLKYKLKIGDNVRYILDEDRGGRQFDKNQRRKQLSEDYYKIAAEVTPYLYSIMGRDGITKEVPRFRLIKLDNTRSKTFAHSVNDEQDFKGDYYIYKIVDYKFNKKDPNITNCIYSVKYRKFIKSEFVINPRPVELSVYQLRNKLRHPTTFTKLEAEFYEKNKDKYKIDKDLKLLVPK